MPSFSDAIHYNKHVFVKSVQVESTTTGFFDCSRGTIPNHLDKHQRATGASSSPQESAIRVAPGIMVVLCPGRVQELFFNGFARLDGHWSEATLNGFHVIAHGP